MPSSLLLLLADAVLLLHVLFVAFVVLGLLAIYLGGILGWHWVRHRRFRLVHQFCAGNPVLLGRGGIARRRQPPLFPLLRF